MNQSQHYDPYNELMCYHFKQSEHSFPVSILFIISFKAVFQTLNKLQRLLQAVLFTHLYYQYLFEI